MKLTSEKVTEIFLDCRSENPRHPVTTGIVHSVKFDPAKLEKHRTAIGELLQELPVEFRPKAVGGGDGWSFLQACDDKDGHQWTGMHMVMEQLFLLGFATDQAKILLPREIWDALPGGMPYIGVLV